MKVLLLQERRYKEKFGFSSKTEEFFIEKTRKKLQKFDLKKGEEKKKEILLLTSIFGKFYLYFGIHDYVTA